MLRALFYFLIFIKVFKTNKKGVSEILVTVLIIGFTIALAAVIMIWGQSFTKGVTKGAQEANDESIACTQDINFDILDACVIDANTIDITVVSNSQTRVESFVARFYIASNSVKSDSLGALDALATPTYSSANLEGEAGLVKRVELLPSIKVGDKVISCPNSLETFGDADLVNGAVLNLC